MENQGSVEGILRFPAEAVAFQDVLKVLHCQMEPEPRQPKHPGRRRWVGSGVALTWSCLGGYANAGRQERVERQAGLAAVEEC